MAMAGEEKTQEGGGERGGMKRKFGGREAKTTFNRLNKILIYGTKKERTKLRNRQKLAKKSKKELRQAPNVGDYLYAQF
jgi:hypothetical protein